MTDKNHCVNSVSRHVYQQCLVERSSYGCAQYTFNENTFQLNKIRSLKDLLLMYIFDAMTKKPILKNFRLKKYSEKIKVVS